MLLTIFMTLFLLTRGSGVLWHFDGLLPGALQIIDHLIRSKRNVFLITNNSSKSVEQLAEKCQNLGLPVTSTSAVLVAYDYHFNYRKLLRATSYICNGALFFATNEDSQLPLKDRVIPETGSIVASVKCATDKEPVVMGKPNQPMFDMLRAHHAIDPKKTVMVGDTLDTDIWFGNRFGMHTICVMTGVTSEARMKNVQSDPQSEHIRPSFVLASVEELLNVLTSCDKS